MTWVSVPALVASVDNAGGFGCLAGGNLPADLLEQQNQKKNTSQYRQSLTLFFSFVYLSD
jgi:NAD(P)H-dependent flavin oxidoreductase YrpB (nitropropane dioxygenase family)